MSLAAEVKGQARREREDVLQAVEALHEDQVVPAMSAEWIDTISKRYIELYEQLIGEKFIPMEMDEQTTEQKILASLKELVAS